MNSVKYELRHSKSKVSALILDLDGTLLDTERATKNVLKDFLAKYGKDLDKKREEEEKLGKTLKESAVAIVRDYDLPLTPDQFIQEIIPMYREKWLQVKALPGAERLIKHLHSHKVPFALASNSLEEYIHEKISSQSGWKDWFTVILGCDQVIEGKPAPYLFEEAAKRMGVDSSQCLVIEDSLVGVKAAKAANMEVVAIPSYGEMECASLADTELHSLLDFKPELWGLPPFEDWIGYALPIDPIRLCFYITGHITEIPEVSIPVQVTGLFFGLVEVDMNKTIKVLVSVGCTCFSSPVVKRTLEIWTVDECDENKIVERQMHILLVGYIGDREIKEDKRLEERRSIAKASLGLQMFSCL